MPSDNPFARPDLLGRGPVLFLALIAGMVLFALLGLAGGWWLFAGVPDAPPDSGGRTSSTASESRPSDPVKVSGPAPLTRDNVMDVFGAIIVAEMYQSFLNVGMLADAYEHKFYPDAECKDRLDKILSVMGEVDRQMAKLSEKGLEEVDAKKVADCRALAALLRVQASELRAYWETPPRDQVGRKEHETRYHKAHDEAWAALKEMLSLKK